MLKEQGFAAGVQTARESGLTLPPYPPIPKELSIAVSSGYKMAVRQFWSK